MTQWLHWTEFMQAWEATQFCEALVISPEMLDLTTWVQEERQGHLVYRTDINMREATVWREANGHLVWDSVHPEWLTECQIDQLHELLIARGFTGTRTDETTPARHLVTFQQGKARLVIHISQREYKALTGLVILADAFLSDCRFGGQGQRWRNVKAPGIHKKRTKRHPPIFSSTEGWQADT